MATDLDPNDQIGERLRSLSAPAVDPAPADAWAGVEQRRRTRRTRHLVAAIGTTFVVLVVAVAAFAATQSGDGGRHVEVVTPSTIASPADPPIADVLPIAKTMQLGILNSAAPIKAGTEVRVELTQSPHRVGDTINTSLQVCFPWADGETCDPSVQTHWDKGDSNGVTEYRLTMPGWVRTAAGYRSCQVIGCRLAMEADDGTRIGTPVLDVESGPKPTEPATLVSANADGLVRFVMDGIDADESYKRYATAVDKESMEAGQTSICVFAHSSWWCDSIVRAPLPVLDGKRHAVDILTNRLLHTSEGWVDCVQVTCAIVVNRMINVTWNAQSTGSSMEIAAMVPYRLPPETPAMKKPSITLDSPAAGVRNNDTVTATIHDLPPNVPREQWREFGSFGQCAAKDLRMRDDCSYSSNIEWTDLPNGDLRVKYQVRTCDQPPGCYLAFQRGWTGYPEVARTERFVVAP